MNLTTKLTQSRGFTIVELLIVVVVIAILAAITIVSYNGITQQANTAAAQAAATNFIKKTEAYVNSTDSSGQYPATVSVLTSAASTKAYAIPASAITLVTTAPLTVQTDPKALSYEVCGHDGDGTAPANIGAMTTRTGVKVSYWNFTSGAAVVVTTGNVTTGGNPNIACFAAAS